MLLEKVFNFVKTILFPIFCIECNREGEWWCVECLSRFPFATDASEAVSPLQGVTVLFTYQESNPPARLIKALKYQGAHDSHGVWQKIFSRFFEKHSPVWLLKNKKICFVPVPLHPKRERERGFNQAAFLTAALCEVLKTSGYDVAVQSNILQRIKDTPHQARSRREERLKNMAGAFVCAENNPPETVVLVDDVYTTGSTLAECARALKAAGVKNIWGLVVARG